MSKIKVNEFCKSDTLSFEKQSTWCIRLILSVLIGKLPDKIAGPPKTNKGKGCQTLAKGAINGANKHPTLEMVEHDPTAWVLRLVGYSSDVTRNTIEKAIADEALPSK